MGGPTKKIATHAQVPGKARPNGVFRLFGYQAVSAQVSIALIATLLAAQIGGCRKTQERRDAEARAPFVRDAAAVFNAGETPADPDGVVEPTWWSVLVAAVPSGRMDDARRMLDTVRATGLTEAYIALRDRRPVIAFGRYQDPADPDAQQGLQRVRRTSVGEVSPFGAAMLMPPVVANTGSAADDANLRTVRQRFGKADAAYTLQIGAYGRGDFAKPTDEELRLFRNEAEKAVRQLRAEGEQAFYYHGPNMSMVTIGVFSEDDHDGSTQPPVESFRLRELRRKFPNNLLNGQGIMDTIRTETGPVKRLQASRLVAIPDK